MDHHPVVLERGVQAVAVGAGPRDVRREGVRGEGHQDAEEEDDRHERGDDVRLELEIPFAEPLHADADVRAEEEQPPEQRPVLPAPEGSEEVVHRHRPIRVVGDVPDTKVVGHERVGEAHDGGADEGHGSVRTESRRLERTRATVRPRGERDREGVTRDDHRAQEQARAERRERVSKDVEQAGHGPSRWRA